MRKFKKVLAAIMTILIINSSIMVTVFADTSKSAGEICASLGVLKGGTNGVDASYLAIPTQRIQAAIIYLRMMGLEDEAKAYNGTDNFEDASLVSNISGATNILAYLKANPKLGWVGDGKKFSPLEEVSAQQFYKVMLTVLGYSQGQDFSYSETLPFAKFLGMGSISKVAKLNNGDMATALVETLGTKMKNGGANDTLIAKLVKNGRITESSAVANGFKIITATIVSVQAPADKTVDAGTTNLNLPQTVKATMSDGKTTDAAVTWDTSKYDSNKAGDYAITGKVTGYDPGVSVKITVKALVFNVNNVTPKNLRQIVVDFNNAVSSTDEATKLTNYTINGVNPVDAALSTDKKSVTLTTGSANFMTNYSTNNKLVINKALGFSADQTIENISVKDIDVPKVVSVVANGPLNLTVNFSEPLDDRVTNYFTASSLVIDDNKVGLDSVNTTYSKDSTAVYLKLAVPIVAGAHTLKIKSPAEGGFIKDSAGYNVAPDTISFNFVQDTSALTAVVTESKERTVKIKFNKPLKQYSFAGNTAVLLSHTYQGLNQVNGAAVTSDSLNQEFTITFLNPLPPGTCKVWLDYADNTDNSKKLQDNYGNIFAPTSFEVTIVADLTKPTATAEFMNAKQIKVTFSKSVNMIFNDPGSAINYSNYILKDSTGTTIPWMGGTPNIVSANTVFLLNTNVEMNGGTLSLSIKNVKDTTMAQNKIDDVTLTINAKDLVAPTLDASAPLAKISDKVIRVNFSETMDPASISDRGIYRIGPDVNHQQVLKDVDTVTLANNNKSAVITFGTAPAGNDHLFIGAVKDAAGNTSPWLSYDAGSIGYNNADIIPSAVEVIAGDRIRITINDQISNPGTINDYVYKIGSGTWVNIGGIVSVNLDPANNKTYIELALVSDIGTNTGLVTPLYLATTDGMMIGNAAANAKNALGQRVKISAMTVCTDKYPPKFVSAAVGYITEGKLKSVVLTFSENLYVPSVQDSDFTVDGFEIDSVSVNNYLVTITLKDKNNSSGEKPKVTLIGQVEDMPRNILNGPVTQTCP